MNTAMNSRSTHHYLKLNLSPNLFAAASAVALFSLLAGPSALAQERPRSNPPATVAQQAGVRPALAIGDRNDSVSELQAILKLLGYYNGSIDGSYQNSTSTAVAAFQRAAGLNADGLTGAATWDRLLPAANGATTTPTTPTTPTNTPTRPTTPTTPTANNPTPPAQPTTAEFPVLRLGMRGSAVTRLQQRLSRLGFFFGEADGVFGPQTDEAVKAAQANFGLDADGVVGSATWDALLQ